jgi:predicted anti-sigma-YlaC factor YlaD
VALKVAAPPILDGVCLCAFVILGRQSHDVGEGAAWFFVVVWPFIASWFAVAVVTGLYASRSRLPARLAVTEVVGVAIALVMRSTITHRDTPIAFIIVAYGFIAISTIGWRFPRSAALI